jgi:hypothetical protein
MSRKPQPGKRERPKKRYRFTKEDCRRGYQAALTKCMESWDLFAWFFHKLRTHYRRKE